MVPHPMQQFPPPQPIAPPQLFPPRCQNSARKPSSPGLGNRLACLTQLDATYAKKPSTEVPIQDLQDVGQPLQQERTLQDHQQCGMPVTPDSFVSGTANGQASSNACWHWGSCFCFECWICYEKSPWLPFDRQNDPNSTNTVMTVSG